MPDNDFIEVYDDALDAATCRVLVERFERAARDGRVQRGATGSGVDTSMKDSWDLQLDRLPDWADARQALDAAAVRGMRRYLRRYAHVALAPLQLKMRDPASGALRLLDADGVAALNDEFLDGLIAKVFRPGGINIQKYVAGQGGYPYWHCEQYPRMDGGEALHRAVLWTIYLNDGFDAGETEFLYQQRRIRPRTGSLLIAPAAFTHTHRGNRPEGSDKFIATSWILYQRAEQLYA